MLSRPIAAALLALTVTWLSACGTGTSHADAGQASSGRSGSDVDAAKSTLAAMLALAEAGDWRGYVDEHYGEAHKFRTPRDRETLVARFHRQWGPEVLAALRRAAKVTPTIQPDGRAVFSENGKPLFELHRADNGRWTFHL